MSAGKKAPSVISKVSKVIKESDGSFFSKNKGLVIGGLVLGAVVAIVAVVLLSRKKRGPVPPEQNMYDMYGGGYGYPDMNQNPSQPPPDSVQQQPASESMPAPEQPVEDPTPKSSEHTEVQPEVVEPKIVELPPDSTVNFDEIEEDESLVVGIKDISLTQDEQETVDKARNSLKKSKKKSERKEKKKNKRKTRKDL